MSLAEVLTKKEKKKEDSLCGFCTERIVKDTKFSGVYYVDAGDNKDKKIHEECWYEYQKGIASKCQHCQEPVANIPSKNFSGKYFKTNKDGEVESLVHSECWTAYCAKTMAEEKKEEAEDDDGGGDDGDGTAAAADHPNPKCKQCGANIIAVPEKFAGTFLMMPNGDHVHTECRAKYLKEHGEKCCKCKEPIARVEGRFNGVFYDVPGHGKCHGECYAQFSLDIAPKCVHCLQPCATLEGTFSGEVFTFDAGQVHKECVEAYQLSVSEKCLHCGEALIPHGKYSGNYCVLSEEVVEEIDGDESKVIETGGEGGGGGGGGGGTSSSRREDKKDEDIEKGTGKVHKECIEAFTQKRAKEDMTRLDGMRRKG